MKTDRPSKPVVFVASAYSQGDVGANVHFQCMIFDRLLGDGRVIPIVPLWTHFQHTVFPRAYEEWLAYDREVLKLCDCCLRLEATNARLQYAQYESRGADAEVNAFQMQGKPIFTSIDDLYAWIK